MKAPRTVPVLRLVVVLVSAGLASTVAAGCTPPQSTTRAGDGAGAANGADDGLIDTGIARALRDGPVDLRGNQPTTAYGKVHGTGNAPLGIAVWSVYANTAPDGAGYELRALGLASPNAQSSVANIAFRLVDATHFWMQVTKVGPGVNADVFMSGEMTSAVKITSVALPPAPGATEALAFLKNVGIAFDENEALASPAAATDSAATKQSKEDINCAADLTVAWQAMICQGVAAAGHAVGAECPKSPPPNWGCRFTRALRQCQGATIKAWQVGKDPCATAGM